jgi:peptidoglycan biosynthesis protein MviN/MurJ (putative lipid II flippase)
VTSRGGPADTGSPRPTSPHVGRPAGERPPDEDSELADPAAEPGLAGNAATGTGLAVGVGRAALLIGGLTVAARMLGFARTVVFAGTVKTSCLSAAYVTANLVPNVIYDIVLGGALTAIVVPILAGPADRAAEGSGGSSPRVGTAGVSRGSPPRADTAEGSGGSSPRASAGNAEVSQISSALLTWTVAILAPVSLALAIGAGPVISLLMPANPASGCPRADLLPIASGMLSAFAPQILLYGLAVVLYGILQAHRKFAAPAVAPILSSLVVIAAYLIFVPLGRHYTTNVDNLPVSAQLTLSVGTTLGVAALALTALVPAWRLRLRVRPTFRFPPGLARRATGLAGVGVAALVAQNASVLVVTRLANAHGGRSGAAVTVYQYGWQVFVSVYAVLAIPVAISAFPVLSARDGAAFDDAAAAATRATALASWLGAGLLAAVALPVAGAFPALSRDVTGHFALALALFAPGLAGYGLVACLSRVLLADSRNRIAAIAVVAGWLLVIVVDLVAVPLVKASAVVPVLGLANTVGMTASGIALIVAVRSARGKAALRGTWRALGAGLAGAAAAAAAGFGVTELLQPAGHWRNAGAAVLAGLCALIVFGAVVAVLDGGDLRSALARVRRRLRST